MSAVSIETHIEGRQGHLSGEQIGRRWVSSIWETEGGQAEVCISPCRPVMVRIREKKPEVLYLLESPTI